MTDKLTDHEYDGIKEYDNPLPRWWLLTFYATIVFTFAYWGYYHVLGVGLMPEQALAAENAEAQKRSDALAASITDEKLVAMSKDPQIVARGKAVFAQNCVACHLDQAQGSIGPNLTDAYWIHGNRALEIRKVISQGVLEKGMTAWQSVLGDSKINDVVAYILSIKNTSIHGKEPQGEYHDPKAE